MQSFWHDLLLKLVAMHYGIAPAKCGENKSTFWNASRIKMQPS